MRVKERIKKYRWDFFYLMLIVFIIIYMNGILFSVAYSIKHDTQGDLKNTHETQGDSQNAESRELLCQFAVEKLLGIDYGGREAIRHDISNADGTKLADVIVLYYIQPSEEEIE